MTSPSLWGLVITTVLNHLRVVGPFRNHPAVHQSVGENMMYLWTYKNLVTSHQHWTIHFGSRILSHGGGFSPIPGLRCLRVSAQLRSSSFAANSVRRVNAALCRSWADAGPVKKKLMKHRKMGYPILDKPFDGLELPTNCFIVFLYGLLSGHLSMPTPDW